MPNHPRRLGAALGLAAASIAHADFEWIGVSSLDWFDTANWLEDGGPALTPPGCGDSAGAIASLPGGVGIVQVQCAGGGSVELDILESTTNLRFAAPLTLHLPSEIENFLTTPAFSLSLGSPLSVLGSACFWDHGSVTGEGSILNSGTIAIGGTSARGLGVSLFNFGTMRSTQGLTLSDGAVIQCLGPWTGHGTINRTASPDSRFFLYDGATVTNDAPGTELRFTVPVQLETGGTLHADGGLIRISAGGSHRGSGVYRVSSDAEIRFDSFPGGGPLVVQGPYVAEGTGQVRVQTEFAILEGDSLTTSLAASSSEGFVLDTDAELVVAGQFRNTGLMTWRAGTIERLGREDDIRSDPGALVRIVTGGGSIPTLDAAPFQNRGGIRQEAELRVLNGARLTTFGSSGVHELRGVRVSGDGTVAIEDSGTLLRPIDSPPTRSEVGAGLDLVGATVINETGELRFSGGGLWVESLVQGEEGATISLRTEPYAIGATTFSGQADLVIEANAAFRVIDPFVINQIGLEGAPGVFRLGGGSPATFESEADGVFRNDGVFRWRSGNLMLGDGLFHNLGEIRTEAANNDLDGRLLSVGHVFLDHSVQAADFALIDVQGGTFTQTSSTLTLGTGAVLRARTSSIRLDGSAGINGAGQIVMSAFSELIKGGGGISTVAADLVAGSGKGARVDVVVESGVLQFTNQPEEPTQWFRSTVAPNAILRWNGVDHTIGPPRPDISVIGDLQGAIALAVGPTEPPRFECDTLFVEGRIRPGGSDGVGQFVVAADLDMAPSGILSINLSPEGEDRLTVDGSALLGGTLRINLLDGFSPEQGATFTVLDASAGVTGQFEDVIGPGVWTTAIVGDELQITLETASGCPLDFVAADGIVGLGELLKILADWGYNPSLASDVDGDDTVGLNDLLLVLASWGPCG